MNEELIVLFLTTIFFATLAIIFYLQKTRYRIALYATCIYGISSVMSIIFYFQPLTHTNGQLNGNISVFPLIYWIVLFLITIIPLIQFDRSSIQSFKCNSRILHYIAFFGFVVSIIPFFEQLMLAPELMGGGAIEELGQSIGDLHDNATLDNMSFLGRNGLRFNIAIYDLSFIILFLQFLQIKKNKKVMFYLFVIIVTRNLTGIIAGHRSAAIEVVMKIILITLIAYPLIESEQKKAIRKYMYWIFGVVGVVFLIITIGRQMLYSVTKSSDFTMAYYLSWYAGEGLINFNQYLPIMKHTTDGQLTCWYFLQLLGQNPPQLTYEYMYGEMTNIQGIPQNIFYTYIGNFVQDFGFFITALLLPLISLIVKGATRVRDTVMPISTLYLFVFFTSIILQGVTSYCYCGHHGKFVIWNLLIYFLLRVLKM